MGFISLIEEEQFVLDFRSILFGIFRKDFLNKRIIKRDYKPII